MPQDVKTFVTYWADPGTGIPDPAHWKDLIVGHEFQADRRDITAHDIRGSESEYSIDIHGFEVHKLPSKFREHLDDEVIKKEYEPEIRELILRLTGGTQTILLNKLLRQQKRDALKPHEFIPGQVQGPNPRVHVDLSLAEPESLITNMLPDSMEAFKKASRWQFFSVWRPIKTIHRDPLAFVDSRTVSDEDYVDIVGERFTGVMVKNGGKKEHRWSYCSGLTPDEVVVLKHCDSKRDVQARRCPHSSIPLPGTEELDARENIEFRALVLHD